MGPIMTLKTEQQLSQAASDYAAYLANNNVIPVPGTVFNKSLPNIPGIPFP